MSEQTELEKWEVYQKILFDQWLAQRDAALIEECANLIHPEDFDEGSSEWCALGAAENAIRTLRPDTAARTLERIRLEARLEERERVDKEIEASYVCMSSEPEDYCEFDDRDFHNQNDKRIASLKAQLEALDHPQSTTSK